MVVHEEYPLHLGLAYLFSAGYLVRTLFVGLRLPGAVGVIVSGFAYSYFMQQDIFEGRDHLQALAFFLVLLTAGTEISLGDLKPYIILHAILPATMEFLGLLAYAHFVFGWTVAESAVLGVVLFGLGDGLVIPKMSEFGQRFPGHQLPRLVFIWAPLEASYALTLFGVMSGLADPAGEEASSLSHLALGNILRIVATLSAGAAIGSAAGWVVSNRAWISTKSKLLIPFTGTTVEAYLVVLATALAGFGISSSEGGPPLVRMPMGLASGSLFQPELMVIVIGSLFARVVDPEVLEEVELTMGGVWVFGQLVLFSMLGTKTDVSVFSQIFTVLPLLVVGLTLRFVGVLIASWVTLSFRPCTCSACYKVNRELVLKDALFCFLATLPRATLQGALGQVPVTERFFQRDPTRRHVQMFISVAARLYIVCMSVVGSILLDALGPVLLKATESKLAEVRCLNLEASAKQLVEEGWTLQERRRTTIRSVGVQKTLSRNSTNSILDGSISSSLKPVRRTSSAAGNGHKKLKKNITFEEDLVESPLLNELASRPTVTAAHARARMSSRDTWSQVTHSSVRSRTSTWSALHQLEARLVAEEEEEEQQQPPKARSLVHAVDEEGDEEGEVWDGNASSGDEDEGEDDKTLDRGLLPNSALLRRETVQDKYIDGDYLPNTLIRGDPVQECCGMPPL